MKFLSRIILPIALLCIQIYYWNSYYSEINTTWNYILIGLLCFLFIFLLINMNGFSIKCESCEEWFAMEQISKDIIDKKPSHIKKEVKVKNNKGEVIKTKEVLVPSTKYTYHIVEKCKNCSYEKEYDKEENKEN